MRIPSQSRMSAVLLLALILLPVPASAQNSMVELNIMSSTFSRAFAVNELDQATGTGYQNVYFGFVWDSGSETRLYALSAWYTWPKDINDWGQVVGEGYTLNGYAYRAFLWENGVTTDLGTLGGAISDASGINNLGQVVGASQSSPSGPYGCNWCAFLWEDGAMSHLGTLGGTHSGASDINDLSQVVGYSETAAGEIHAFLWEDGVMTDLGTLGGAQSYARGINDLGQVVGESTTASGETHAFLWENGMMTDLGTLGRLNSTAASINSLGQVVGYSYTDFWSDSRAFLWENGMMNDLGTLGGETSYAEDINDLGHIVGWSETMEGAHHAFLWTSVLPPATPEERIGAVIEQVDALVAGGWLNEGQGNALRSKLDSVLRQLGMENKGAACNLLQAFSNQTGSLVHAGALTAEHGQPLIDSADAVSSELCP